MLPENITRFQIRHSSSPTCSQTRDVHQAPLPRLSILKPAVSHVGATAFDWSHNKSYHLVLSRTTGRLDMTIKLAGRAPL